MRYLPKSPADRQAMLKAIGARSIDDLFAPIPAEYRLERDLKVPRQMAESEIVDWFRERSREKATQEPLRSDDQDAARHLFALLWDCAALALLAPRLRVGGPSGHFRGSAD